MTEPSPGGGSGRPGILYLVATPIGNLEDVTLRALEVLRQVDLVACEDTRHSMRLLDRHGLSGKKTIPFHAHNEHARASRLVGLLQSGKSLALVTDAGTPSVSDPGYLLVRAAREAGIRVSPVPGASAVMAALVASGLPAETFTFGGFLPPRTGERRRRIADLDGPHTLILFEAPHRLGASLTDLADVLGARRPAAVCRELTKVHEEIVHGSLQELAGRFGAAATRGEITLVIAGDPEASRRPEAPLPSLAEHHAAALHAESGDRKRALRRVARERGMSRRQVYQALLGEDEAARLPGGRVEPERPPESMDTDGDDSS